MAFCFIADEDGLYLANQHLDLLKELEQIAKDGGAAWRQPV
jgi:hypothetical protein